MTQKLVQQLDADGYYVGPTWADASPEGPDGVYLMPARTVDAEAPETPANHVARWLFPGWGYYPVAPTVEPEPEPPSEPTEAQLIAATLGEYTRREVQAVIAVFELNAKVDFLVLGKPVAETLANSLLRNPSYRIARGLEDACRVIERSFV